MFRPWCHGGRSRGKTPLLPPLLPPQVLPEVLPRGFSRCSAVACPASPRAIGHWEEPLQVGKTAGQTVNNFFPRTLGRTPLPGKNLTPSDLRFSEIVPGRLGKNPKIVSDLRIYGSCRVLPIMGGKKVGRTLGGVTDHPEEFFDWLLAVA